MTIVWRAEMAVDDDIIDEDHQWLVAIVNRFQEIPAGEEGDRQVSSLLGELSLYAAHHFAREEELQRAMRYPFRDAHRFEHEALKRQLAAVIAQEQQASRQTREALTTLLHDWLIDHIIKSDLLMRPYILQMRKRLIRMTALPEWIRNG